LVHQGTTAEYRSRLLHQEEPTFGHLILDEK
jgi:hypothetical protein